uniref:Aspartyltransferase n=1 Tax=Anisakis simplex TaxID=6269 RepID=A0A0M3J2Z1_ANISI
LRGEDDGHSSGDEMEAEPAPPEPEDFFDPNPDFNEFNPFPFPLPHQDPEPQPDPELPPTNNDPVPEDESGAAQPHHYWLRRPRSPRQPRRREQQRPQPFRPHNIESMRPEHQAELSAPSTDAYQVCENNLIYFLTTPNLLALFTYNPCFRVPFARLCQVLSPIQNREGLENPRAEGRMSPTRNPLHVVRPRHCDALGAPLGGRNQGGYGLAPNREVHRCLQTDDGGTKNRRRAPHDPGPRQLTLRGARGGRR